MSIKNYDVVVTDLHHRISGVSTTIRTLLPILDRQVSLVLLSNNGEKDIAHFGLLEAFRSLRQSNSQRPSVIWHVRRNNEMRWALIAKYLFRANIKIVFTSAAKRRHSAYPRWLISKMDAIIATSDEAASFVKPVIATIPHGVDCSKFHPMPLDEAFLSRYGMSGTHHIGIFGRVRPEKGTDLFVSAMLSILPKHPNFRAVIVGKTTRKYQSFKRELMGDIGAAGLSDRFEWLDEVPFNDMPKIYNAMSLVTAPARYEGFGMVPLEAMACGKPVIASRTGAYGQMIDPGVNGWLVNTDDLEGFTEVLSTALSNESLLSGMGISGMNKVKQEFSAEVEADSIIGVYKKIQLG